MVVAFACGPISAPTLASPIPRDVLVGSTTTTQDTGLLDVLIPDFERRSGFKVKLVVGGSGQVLTQAGRGDLDVVLTHSPAAEEQLVASGAGVDRRLVMHNDFVLVGPTTDPAGVKGLAIGDALKRIYAQGATFASRDDSSGTNVKERDLWKGAGLDPSGRPWYLESGVGQLQNLQLADSRDAYTLTDRGTFLSGRSLLRDLAIVVEHGKDLLNIYHVTRVDPAKFPRVNAEGAKAFADYLTGTDGQSLIASFGVAKYGQATFIADAGKNEDELQ
ncbi:MAG TPA: substrate-binding domain-containing protein [Candidatus Limnocylindria bacterium]